MSTHSPMPGDEIQEELDDGPEGASGDPYREPDANHNRRLSVKVWLSSPTVLTIVFSGAVAR